MNHLEERFIDRLKHEIRRELWAGCDIDFRFSNDPSYVGVVLEFRFTLPYLRSYYYGKTVLGDAFRYMRTQYHNRELEHIYQRTYKEVVDFIRQEERRSALPPSYHAHHMSDAIDFRLMEESRSLRQLQDEMMGNFNHVGLKKETKPIKESKYDKYQKEREKLIEDILFLES